MIRNRFSCGTDIRPLKPVEAEVGPQQPGNAEGEVPVREGKEDRLGQQRAEVGVVLLSVLAASTDHHVDAFGFWFWSFTSVNFSCNTVPVFILRSCIHFLEERSWRRNQKMLISRTGVHIANTEELAVDELAPVKKIQGRELL